MDTQILGVQLKTIGSEGPNGIKEVIRELEHQFSIMGGLVMDNERSHRFILWLKALHVGLITQDEFIKRLRKQMPPPVSPR